MTNGAKIRQLEAMLMILVGMEVDGEMETEELIQAANEIRKICDNADGCDECPFCRQDGLYSVVCKFLDKTGGYCSPCEWSLDGEDQNAKNERTC